MARRAIRFAVLAACGCGLLLGVIGCAGRHAARESTGLGEDTPASGAVSLEELLPWARPDGGAPAPDEVSGPAGERLAAFEIADEAHAGRVLIESRRPGEQPGTWFVERRLADSGEVLQAWTCHVDPRDGSLVMPHQVNHERGVRVEMSPPGLVMPAVIRAGEVVASESRMRLPLIENPKRLRERGTGRAEFTFAGRQRVRTASGSFDAVRIREVFTSRLSAATAVRTTDRWLAPGYGLVGESWTEEVRVAGLVIERSSRALWRRPMEGIEPSAGEAGGRARTRAGP